MAFLIVGALLLLLAGVLDENYLLGGLALFMLLGYPHYLRASQLIKQVRAKMTSKGLSAIPRRTAINSCFNCLFLETKAKLTPAQRIQAVKLTVPALIRAPASWKQIFVAASLYGTTCFAPIGIAFYLAQESYFVAHQNTQTNLQLDTLEEEKENSANFTQLNVEEVLSPAEIAVVQQWPTPEQRWAYAIQQTGLSPFFQDYLAQSGLPLSENELEDVEPTVYQAYLKLAQKEAQAFSPGDPRRIKTILHTIDLMSDIEATSSLMQLQTTLETVATDEKWLTQVRILRVQRDPNLDRQTALELLNRAKTYYLNASLSNGKAKQWSSEQLFLSENLALELSQRGAADQAQALLMHMQANVPPPENVFFNESFEHALTWIRLQQGKAQEAVHSLEQALAKPSSHKNSRLYTDLAWAQGQSGDTQAALATLKKLEENYLTTSQSNHWLTWFQPTIPPPSLIVDQLYWAEKGQDIKTLKKAKKALARLRRTEGRSLTFMAPSKKSWDTPLRQARKTTLERYQNI